MKSLNCTLCNWTDYESDWGGKRWLKTKKKRICPECGKRVCGDNDDPNPILDFRLLKRLEKRNSIYKKLTNLLCMLKLCCR